MNTQSALKLFGLATRVVSRRNITSQCLSRPKKELYPRTYKVRVIKQDGSSFMTRYHEPVGVIQLPLDPESLTEEQKKARLKKMRDDKIVKVKEYKENVTFDRRAMARLMKKRKK